LNIHLRLHPTLSDCIKYQGDLLAEGETLLECLRSASIKYPLLGKLLWQDSSEFNPAVLVFLNEQRIERNEFDRQVHEGDQIDLIPAISGG